MTEKRDTLIDQLVAELPAGPKPLVLSKYLAAWLIASAVFVVAITLFMGPLRPGVAQQLLTPRFALESIAGLLTIVWVAAIGFKFAVPAANNKVFIGLGIAVAVLWLLNYVIGLYYPTLAPSMAGKRDHCVWEVGVYATVPLLLGLFLIKRGYVLNWPTTGLSIGLASGFIPALLMQFACLYDAKHTLLMHVGPALLVGVFGLLLGMLLQSVAKN